MSQMSLVQMSLSGGAMILVVMLIRLSALHKLPKRLFPPLWCLALLRLLIPFSLPAGFSVYSLFSRPASPVPSTFSAATASPLSPIAWEGASGGQTAVSSPLSAVDLWGIAWLTGMLACAGCFLAVYCRCRRRFQEALPVQNDFVNAWLRLHKLRRAVSVRQSDQIAAPLTYGILRPVILLPKSTDWEDLESLGWVLAHEWVHIRRLDGGLKLLLTAALCVHWFNPLAWVMLILANRDIELACDETVLKLFGGNARAGYALTLIRMEERKSGLDLAGNHFSKTPIEERIQSIMKRNRNSTIAVALALSITAGAVGVFATSAKAETFSGSVSPAADMLSNTYTTEEKDTLMSRANPDGSTSYSWDDGKTWTAMTDEEFAEAYPTPDVEWWTAEEYAAWLENEKKNLESMLGSKGWTASTGWFTWTQEMVDEAIADYEEILDMLKQGFRVSKTVDGQEDTMLVMNPLDQVLGSGSYEVTEKAEEYDSTWESVDYENLFASYKLHGLTFHNAEGSLYWNGQRVRIFVDGAEVGGGYTSQFEHYDPEGTIDVRTVRERVDNGDGSYNPMGPLAGLEEFEPEQMFLDALEGQRYVNAEFQYEADRTAQELERYAEFGLTYSFNPNLETGPLSMSWNGKPVRSLYDLERQLWICNSLGTKGLNLEAVYENGQLTGLRESDEANLTEAGFAMNAEATAAESDGNDGSGETIAQRMAQYAPYGVSYQEINGQKRIRYNGQPVKTFVDIQPNGSVFSVGSTDDKGISLVTAYDGNGKLKGVQIA